MASNTQTQNIEVNEYIDKKEARSLDKKTLNKMAVRSMFLQGSFNYERMQAGGWLYSILPGLTKIHKNKKDLSTSMKHNLEFFNTHPFLITFVMGIVLSLEQKKADTQTIRSLRVVAMGPLGGIGDAIFWFTLVPIASYVNVNIVTEIPIGESTIVVQEILDGIMPKLLPLGLTFFMYSLVKRNTKPMTNILVLILIGLAGAFFGIF